MIRKVLILFRHQSSVQIIYPIFPIADDLLFFDESIVIYLLINAF